MYALSCSFVCSPGRQVISSRSAKILHSSSTQFLSRRRRTNMSTSKGPPTVQPWPFTRFVRTALWYSPLGGLVGRGVAPQQPVVDPAQGPAAAPCKDRAQMTVFVTGASGGVGSRVVRELLRDGTSVRALVRSRARGVKALGRIGVDVQEYEKTGKLQLIIADLFNLRPEMFRGVDAVISATGTRVGPVNDTPDRAMYYQGVKFFEPTILEDTPQNVEYRGVKQLAELVATVFRETTEAVDDVWQSAVPVWTFDNADEVRATWGSLDDVVMGGVSQSNVSVDNGELVFSGMLSVSNNGGFASVRSVDFPKPMNLGGFDGVSFRVKADGKRYKFIVRCDGRWDGISYCHSFDTIANEWVDVKIPFHDFQTVFRAKTMPDSPPLDKKSISALQIMLSKFEYDGGLNPNFAPGNFELRVQTIHAYKERYRRDFGPSQPRFVHLGTSGSARVLQADEAGVGRSPAEKRNSELGRIMEWKLAGEDTVRQELAEVGYVIVRSTALTEEDAVGLDSLKFEQGDKITGKLSRNDCARLLVEALHSGTGVNKTFEVAQVSNKQGGDSTFSSKTESLATDRNEDRSFAPFPFVPK